MAAKNAILGVGGLAALGFGGYFAITAKDIAKYESEEKSVAKMLDGEKKKLSSTAKGITEQEQRIADLQAKEAAQQKGIKEAEAKLEAARKQVVALEAAYNSKVEEAQKIAKEAQTAASKLSNLHAEQQRAKEAVTLGEKSLTLARAQAAEARKLLNPLNHPKMAAFMGKK